MIKIIDSTLREGRQSLYAHDILKIQKEYLSILTKMGVTDIEYRNPYVSKKELIIFRKLQRDFPNLKFHVHIYLNEKNVSSVINDHTVKYVSTFTKLPAKEEVSTALSTLLDDRSKKIRVGIENANNIPYKLLKQFFLFCNKKKNISRIGFSDTLGLLTPEETRKFYKKIMSADIKNKDIEFHLHNDYGLAAANSLQLLLEARKLTNDLYLSVSMMGIGERNGILSYGDLFSNFLRLKISHNLDLKEYGKLLNLIEINNINFNRDPAGPNSFSHFASSHLIGEMGQEKYQAIDSEQLGLKSRLFFNELTDQKVINYIAKTKLNKQLPKNTGLLKKIIIVEMKKRGKKNLNLEEVLFILHSYYG